MKSASMLLTVLVLSVATPPAIAATIAKRPNCEALLTGLAHCNAQTPDAIRIACQKDICVSYGECLAGPGPMSPIPQLSTLCFNLGAPVPTPSPTRAQVTSVR